MSALDIPAIRASAALSSVAARYVKIRRAGPEWTACCPFHNDKSPSFTINDAKGFFHCFGCDAHGDVLDFVMRMENVGLRRAAELIGQPLNDDRTRLRPMAPKDGETRKLAAGIWADASPIGGTPAENYLRSRGIICALPETLRFARLRYGPNGSEHPCLVAAVTDAHEQLCGIQRTFLNSAGSGKAKVPKPKLSLGGIRGGAVRLAPVAGELVLSEGVEDALTLQQELGVATWAAAGVGNLRTLELPSVVRSVIIGADRDESGEAGAQAAAERFAAEGRTVRIIRPLDGHKDFNDELRGIAA
jgi:DNA primase